MPPLSLQQALLNQTQQNTASNPFIQTAQTLNQTPVYLPGASNTDVILAGLLKGIGSGFFNTIGQNQVTSQNQQLANQFNQAFQSPNPVEALGQNSQTSQFAPLLALEQQQNAAALQDAVAKQNLRFQSNAQLEGIRHSNREKEIRLRQALMPKPKVIDPGQNSQIGQEIVKDIYKKMGLSDRQATSLASAPSAVQTSVFKKLTNANYRKLTGKSIDTLPPQYQTLVTKAVQGIPLSEKDSQILAAAPGSIRKEVTGIIGKVKPFVGERFRTNQTFKARQTLVAGALPIGSNIPTSNQVKELNKRRGGLENIIKILDLSAASGQANGFINIFGTDAKVQQSLSSMFLNAGRLATNSGANFTETEQQLIKNLNVTFAADNPTQALAEFVKGVDQSKFALEVKSILRKTFAADLLGQGQLDTTLPLSAYAPKQLKRAFGTSKITPELIKSRIESSIKGRGTNPKDIPEINQFIDNLKEEALVPVPRPNPLDFREKGRAAFIAAVRQWEASGGK